MEPLKHKICQTDDIAEGKALGVEVDGAALFLVKRNGEIYCYQNACPHLGVELEWTEHEFLDPDGQLIQCHLHGALFEIESGHCISGPCAGDALRAIPIEIVNDTIYLHP